MGGVDESQQTLTAGLHPDEVPVDHSEIQIPAKDESIVFVHCSEKDGEEQAKEYHPHICVITGTAHHSVFV